MLKNLVIFLAGVSILVTGCAGKLPDRTRVRASYAIQNTGSTLLGEITAAPTTDQTGNSGFHLLAGGLDAFVARAFIVDHARVSLDIQYYLFHNDLVGRLFTWQLIRAAERGVRVRLLVDDMDREDRDMNAAIMSHHPNIEIRLFNPFRRGVSRIPQLITRYGTVTRRMHNKSVTADNQVTILGGRNIGNEYFQADPNLSFTDLDVLAIGPVVNEVSNSFDKYWNSDLAYPVNLLNPVPVTQHQFETARQELADFIQQQSESAYISALRKSDLAKQLNRHQLDFHWGPALIVSDQPEKISSGFDQTEYHLAPQLAPHWEAVKKELIIFSPYFVPGREGTAFLTEMVRRGVRVRILTNSLASNDVGIVHSGYIKYRKKLLKGGVEIYEMSNERSSGTKKSLFGRTIFKGSGKASLHAKSFVFDREKVFIGSLNLDPRSLFHNTEIGVLLSSQKLGQIMGDGFDTMTESRAFRLELVKGRYGTTRILWHGRVDGKPETFSVEPYTSLWERLNTSVLSLLPLESQL
ncbi:MAG: phospholipase D family protein [Desulfobacterales bacterium]|nr:phospholipase D family protein [Desulfobacterales bacterium]